MRAQRFVRFFAMGIIIAIIIALGFGEAVLHLWNWLMPAVFGFHAITYWQALGLLGLSWLLFGGPRGFFGGHRHGGHWRHRMRERWESMTPEERERFRQGMAHRCGHGRQPMPETKA